MKNKIKNLLAFFRIEIKKIPKKRTSWQVNIGKYPIKMNPNGNLLDIYLSNKEYAAELGRLVSSIYKKYPGFSMTDIGANVGDTIAIVKNVIEDIKILCIEGDDESFEYLKSNSKQFNNVHLYKYYLGQSTEYIRALVNKKGWNNTLKISFNQGELINIYSFDDFLSKENICSKNIKLLKIDTEGFDNNIIRGAKNYITTSNPILYFEYNIQNLLINKENGLGIFKFLKNLGYCDLIFFDSNGKFLTHTILDNTLLIEDLHHYSSSYEGHYYDLCLFHEKDADVALEFATREREIISKK